jgi:predicted nucleotidyltransferase
MGINPGLDIKPQHQNLLLNLLKQFLPGIQVWAFGSRVKGCARATSDLDLVVFTNTTQKSQVFALQEALDESNFPYKVDLLIWNEIPDSFKENIKEKYIRVLAEP